ncbi:exodeoxyribonuclease V subunit beta [Musicola paradisiaca]|uniref:RecBCD enzyme subunit RecB n=1 Tax=Musicola paradisiaca (strain Ech703) TaxID=579405 RepID=C6CC22_MUSP7|nr:exodeoxyribonuclease V subunit beta [Musicola paradisiaca]ACS86782.1 exodeoxyribonuclease V, beta subunit [Musicola paradisiaca Ech703]
MNERRSESLNLLTLPLLGERLIEASAGTGKTYTLAGLYLRLLLGLGGENAYPRPLSVEEILVVTFTEAATQELRDRIRDKIHSLYLACLRNESDEPLVKLLLAEIPDAFRAEAAQVLLRAERQMDEAAVHTIHGFCQRMLATNAFESGVLFEQRLVEDETPLYRQACADFWRRFCYPLPLSVASELGREWAGPDALLQDLMPYLHGEMPLLRRPPDPDETLLARHQNIIARLETFKAAWLGVAKELEALIGSSGVDKRRYSSRYLPLWLSNVTAWAQQPTRNYQLPKELERFGQRELNQRTIKGEPPQHAIFLAVDDLLQSSLTLRDLAISLALSEVRLSIREEKQRRAELGFDDLLSRLDEALQQDAGQALAQAIRERYPLAMIDEFQDTDAQQYRIFSTIYADQPQCGWLMIGDPKQAIYAFRGADIFTYMRAREDVPSHYTLDTNWRSTPGMVEAVNRLFQCADTPFVFSQIPFLPVNAADNNRSLTFEYQGSRMPAMRFWLTGREGVGVGDYQQAMARQCADSICSWLSAGQRGEAWLTRGEMRRPVVASDITVLVRSRYEAALIRQALGRLNIPSVYLSNRDSVFAASEATELLWLLQAVLAPEQERLLRGAMATSLMGMDAAALDELCRNESQWDALVDEFAGYRHIWGQRGVLPMLRRLMQQHRLAENLLASPEGERRLTDVLHIGELLQEASAALDSEHALVRWLAQQIAQPNSQSESQQLRLESDRHLVQIVTIHKSKGLEYALVWLPFICNFRAQPQGIYHDRQTLLPTLDLNGGEESRTLAEEERLAEDLRLLYVALTRSIYHCAVGVAPLYLRSQKKEGNSDMHSSALGYLLQRGAAAPADVLVAALEAMAGDDIDIADVVAEDGEPWRPALETAPLLQVRQNKRQLHDRWRVTSYSGLQQHGASAIQELFPRLDLETKGEEAQAPDEAFTPHTFPRGAAPGTFLHSLFEQLEFTAAIDEPWLLEQLRQQGMAEEWQPVVKAWLATVLDTPLTPEHIRLSALESRFRQSELQFYLPIASMLDAGKLDRLAKTHDPLSADCPALDFQQVKGMLKGFIDLVFFWQGRYYLLDYKSNWLGPDAGAYTQPAMHRAMAEHRYDLQYQLYSLALHRYLRHRVPGYDYQRHFGGVIYLFLRGISAAYPGHGVFFTKPAQLLVDGLDLLFQGDTTIMDDEGAGNA